MVKEVPRHWMIIEQIAKCLRAPFPNEPCYLFKANGMQESLVFFIIYIPPYYTY